MSFDEWLVVNQQKLLTEYLKELKQAEGEKFGEAVRMLHTGIHGRTLEETEQLFLLALVAKLHPGAPTLATLQKRWEHGWPAMEQPSAVPSWDGLSRPQLPPPRVPSLPTPGAVGPRAGWSPEQWGQDAGFREASAPVTSLPPVATPLQDADGLPPLPVDLSVASATPPLFLDDKARKHFVRVLGILRNELYLMRQSCPEHNWLDLQRCGVLTPEIVSILRLVDKTNKSIDWRSKREKQALEHPRRVRSYIRDASGAG